MCTSFGYSDFWDCLGGLVLVMIQSMVFKRNYYQPIIIHACPLDLARNCLTESLYQSPLTSANIQLFSRL